MSSFLSHFTSVNENLQWGSTFLIYTELNFSLNAATFFVS